MREENILVLVDLESDGELSILRGEKISKAYNGSLYVSFFITDEDRLNNKDEIEFYTAMLKKISSFYGVKELILKEISNETDYFKVLESIKKELNITHLVMAHEAEDRLSEIIHGSLINFLLKYHPELELHLIPPKYAFPDFVNDYENGVRAFINNDPDNPKFSRSKKYAMSGIYFRESATDFETGIFVANSDNDADILIFKIVDCIPQKIKSNLIFIE